MEAKPNLTLFVDWMGTFSHMCQRDALYMRKVQENLSANFGRVTMIMATADCELAPEMMALAGFDGKLTISTYAELDGSVVYKSQFPQEVLRHKGKLKTMEWAELMEVAQTLKAKKQVSVECQNHMGMIEIFEQNRADKIIFVDDNPEAAKIKARVVLGEMNPTDAGAQLMFKYIQGNAMACIANYSAKEPSTPEQLARYIAHKVHEFDRGAAM